MNCLLFNYERRKATLNTKSQLPLAVDGLERSYSETLWIFFFFFLLRPSSPWTHRPEMKVLLEPPHTVRTLCAQSVSRGKMPAALASSNSALWALPSVQCWVLVWPTATVSLVDSGGCSIPFPLRSWCTHSSTAGNNSGWWFIATLLTRNRPPL